MNRHNVYIMARELNQVISRRSEIILSLFSLPLHIINILFGIDYIDISCAEKVGLIIFNFPVWLILVGSVGIVQFVCTLLNFEKTLEFFAINNIVWMIIGNILFWYGTQDCSGDLYKIGFVNMLSGYITIGISIIIFSKIYFRKNF